MSFQQGGVKERDRNATGGPLPLPNVRQPIAARQKWPRLWRKSADPEDFKRELLARLLAALEVARATHADADVTRIQDEIRALDEACIS